MFKSNLLYFLCLSLSIFIPNVTLETDYTPTNISSSEWFLDEIFNKYSQQDDLITTNEIDSIIDYFTEHSLHFEHDGINAFNAENLLELFNINPLLINKDLFIKLSPSLVWIALEKHIYMDNRNSNLSLSSNQTCKSSKSIKYLYGSITMIVTWITSLFSVIIISRLNKGKKLIVLTLNALAIGTLLSDALIHIIPHALGANGHNHDHASEKHENTDKSENDAIWKMFLIVCTLSVLMILDWIGGGHSHGEDSDHDKANGIHTNCNHSHNVNEFKLSEIKQHDQINISNNVKKQKKLIELLRGNGLIVFLANLFHKCCDGLVIGAAFNATMSLGLSTALANLFHEIPHELGDYALLRTSGFMNWQIILLNTIGSFSGFCSFLIISAIENQTGIKEWVFAITAGLFLYISLAGMVPKMKEVFKKKDGKRDKLSIALTIFGFWIGTAFMLLLAIFEDNISVNIFSCTAPKKSYKIFI